MVASSNESQFKGDAIQEEWSWMEERSGCDSISILCALKQNQQFVSSNSITATTVLEILQIRIE